MALLIAASDATDAVKGRADFVCDGAYDQEQIEAAMAIGGRVDLSAGAFHLSETLTLAEIPVVLRGEGPKATQLVYTLTSPGNGIHVDGRHHSVLDLGIVNGLNLRYGLVLAGAYNRVRNLYIERPQSAGVRGEPANSQSITSGVLVRDSAGYGFHLYGVSNTVSACIASRSVDLGIGGSAGFMLQEVGGVYHGLIVDRHDTGYEIAQYAESVSLYAPYAERCNRALLVRSVEANHPQAVVVNGGFFYDCRHSTDAAVVLQRVTGMAIDGLRIREVASGEAVTRGKNAAGVTITNLWWEPSAQVRRPGPLGMNATSLEAGGYLIGRDRG